MKMNEKYIRLLLANYYEGTTSLEEENFLRHYFASKNIPDDLKADREIFAPFFQSTQANPTESFEYEILQSIQSAKIQKKSNPNSVVKLVSTWAAAASVVLIIGLAWLITRDTNESILADTFDNPHLALQETQRVLALVGSKINMAQAELKPLSRLEMPKEVLEPLGSFSKNLEYINRIQSLEKPKELPFIKHIFGDIFDDINKYY